jgi:hypothetical protein
LRKVTSTQQIDATHLKVFTSSDVSFLDAFDTIDINSTNLMSGVDPDEALAHMPRYFYSATGARARARRVGDPISKQFSLPIDYETGFSPASGLTITPSFHMNPSLNIYVNKASGQDPVVKMTVSSDLRAGVSLVGSLTASNGVSVDKQLYKHCFAGGFFFISFIPVYYSPCVTIDGKFELNAEVDVQFSKRVTYMRTGMQYGFEYVGAMQQISNAGTERLDNQPLSVTSGCTLTASATVTPAFEVTFNGLASIKLATPVTLEGTAAAPAPKSYHGEGVSCPCSPSSGFLGAHLTAKATAGAGITFISGADFSYDFFTYNKVLLNKCWTMPSSVAAVCKQKADAGCTPTYGCCPDADASLLPAAPAAPAGNADNVKACPSAYPVSCSHSGCAGCMPVGADCCTNCKYCAPGNVCRNGCGCCSKTKPNCCAPGTWGSGFCCQTGTHCCRTNGLHSSQYIPGAPTGNHRRPAFMNIVTE